MPRLGEYGGRKFCGGGNEFGFAFKTLADDDDGFVGLLPLLEFDGFAHGRNRFHGVAV